jgi:uncharacterized protein YcnI
MNRSLPGRLGVISAAAAVIVLAVAGPASAHVTVNPGTATAGSYSKVTFRVPTESATASTTKVEVNLPTDNPVASVSTKPVPGWTATAVKSKLAKPLTDDDGGQITEAVSKITWTASSGSEIKPGQFQEFDVSLGPLPASGQLVFKALQYYSDGSIVRWIDEPSADGSEPEHPAPVLKLTAATATGAVAAAPPATAASVSAAMSDKSGDGGLIWGIVALVVAIAALALGLLAYRRSAPAHA